MSGTGNELAVRNGYAPAQAAPAALAIQPGQTTWDEFQNAALNQLGLKNASNADRAVFLHQCQRTGLDPFSRQIMMIERREKQGNDWVSKWTIQTGIEGWRTIRDRAERREGVRGTLSRFTYYDHEDNERKVWTRPEPPAAVEVTYTVRDRNGIETPYVSVLRYDEYVQTKEINGQRVPIAQWAAKKVHMTEKCTEADVYRKTFPQDYSGIELSDAMPPAEDLPPLEPQRQRITAAGARAAQTVTATVVTPDVPPADGQVSPGPAAPVATPAGPAGGTPRRASSGQVGMIRSRFTQITGIKNEDETPGQKQARLRYTSRLARIEFPGIASTKELTADDAALVIQALSRCGTAGDIEALIDSGALADGPREDGESGE